MAYSSLTCNPWLCGVSDVVVTFWRGQFYNPMIKLPFHFCGLWPSEKFVSFLYPYGEAGLPEGVELCSCLPFSFLNVFFHKLGSILQGVVIRLCRGKLRHICGGKRRANFLQSSEHFTLARKLHAEFRRYPVANQIWLPQMAVLLKCPQILH